MLSSPLQRKPRSYEQHVRAYLRYFPTVGTAVLGDIRVSHLRSAAFGKLEISEPGRFRIISALRQES